MPPPSLHLVEGSCVGVVTACDHLPEMLVLCLDDLVSAACPMSELTRAAQIFACHCLHQSFFLPFRWGCRFDRYQTAPAGCLVAALIRLNRLVVATHRTSPASWFSSKCFAASSHTSSGTAVSPVGEAGHGFGQGQRRSLLGGEEVRFAPGGHGEEPLVALARLLGADRAAVDAGAAAVDLAGSQVGELHGGAGHPRAVSRLDDGLDTRHRVREQGGWVLDSCCHALSDASPPVCDSSVMAPGPKLLRGSAMPSRVACQGRWPCTFAPSRRARLRASVTSWAPGASM